MSKFAKIHTVKSELLLIKVFSCPQTETFMQHKPGHLSGDLNNLLLDSEVSRHLSEESGIIQQIYP